MAKPMRVIFCILSLVLVAALVVACVNVANSDGTDKSKNEESSLAPTESSATVSEDAFVSEVVESVSPPTLESEESSAVSDTADESEEQSESLDGEESAPVEESVTPTESEPLESEPDSSEPDSSEPDSSTPDSSTPDSSVPEVLDGGTDPIVTAPGGIFTSNVDAFFNNSMFVGHSVIVHFYNRTTKWRNNVDADILGDAMFCCSSSFSFYNNLYQTPETADNVLPKYRGEAYNIEDLPAATGRDTMYLSLMGLNDLGMVGGPDTCVDRVRDEVVQCIEAIREKNPELKLVVLASTYLTRDKSYANLNNRNLSLLNNKVLDYCNANGIDFIDVASPLRDGGGYLASRYSSDSYCHLTDEAYYIWMDVLREYALQKGAGTWQNPQSIPLFE